MVKKFFLIVSIIFTAFLLTSCEFTEILAPTATQEVTHVEEHTDKVNFNDTYYEILDHAKLDTAFISYNLNQETYGSSGFVYKIVVDGVAKTGLITHGTAKLYIMASNNFLIPLTEKELLTQTFSYLLPNTTDELVDCDFVANYPLLNLALFTLTINLDLHELSYFGFDMSSKPTVNVQDRVFSFSYSVISEYVTVTEIVSYYSPRLTSGHVLSYGNGFIYSDVTVNSYGMGAPLFNANTGAFLGLNTISNTYLDPTNLDPSLASAVPLVRLFGYVDFELFSKAVKNLETLSADQTSYIQYLPIAQPSSRSLGDGIYTPTLGGFKDSADKAKDVADFINSRFFSLSYGLDYKLAAGVRKFLFDIDSTDTLVSVDAISDIPSLNIKKGEAIKIDSYDELLYYFINFDFKDVSVLTYTFFANSDPNTMKRGSQNIGA